MTISIQDFIDRCNMGMDIEFSYRGKTYGVLAWTKAGITVYEQNRPASEKIFQTADDALDGFIVDGIPLRNAITTVIQSL